MTQTINNEALVALAECYDSWASGAWVDSNAVYDLAETMGHIQQLLGFSQ